MNNNKILQYLNGEMTDAEKTKFEDEVSNNVLLKNTLDKMSLKLGELNKSKLFSNELPDTFRNTILVNANEKLVERSKLKPIINMRYGLSFSLVLLFALLFQFSENTNQKQTFLSFSNTEKQLIKEIAKDKETIKDIYHSDIVAIQTVNVNKTVDDSYIADIKEIAKYDKDFLNRNNIPIVDEINLDESISDEQIEELFSKLDTYN